MNSSTTDATGIAKGVVSLALLVLVCWWAYDTFIASHWQYAYISPNFNSAILVDAKFKTKDECVSTIRQFEKYEEYQYECGNRCHYEGEEFLGVISCKETAK